MSNSPAAESLPARALLIDLDGTVYFKDAPIPGAAEAITALRAAGFRLLFLTNTDSKTPRELCAKVTQLGFDIKEDEISTCVEAALAYIAGKPGRAYGLLPRHLAAKFAALGRPEAEVKFVVVGDGRENTYAELNTAFRYVMAGAEIVGLQKGRFFLTREGYNLDTGAFITLLEFASGQAATIVGKPAPAFFQAALDQLGVAREDAIIVGDDVLTDIAGANALGIPAVLVRTGKFTLQAFPPAGPQPSRVIDSLADLPRWVRLAISQADNANLP